MLNQKEQHNLLICDISTTVRFQRLQGQREVSERVSALVSHDMRTPLNSIIAMIDKNKRDLKEIKSLL